MTLLFATLFILANYEPARPIRYRFEPVWRESWNPPRPPSYRHRKV